MKIEPLTACPGCHSTEAEDILLGQAPLKRCRNCKLTYAPEAADPDEIYVEGYFAGEVGDFGLNTLNPEFREFLTYVGNIRMNLLEKVQRTPGSLLDVGCGTAETLAVAKSRGWNACGVDLVPEVVEAAKADFGLDVRYGLLQDSGFPERSFDAVMATHVLEHMADGTEFLQLLARWVKPGGHILIEVPNWDSLDRVGNKDAWFGLRPKEHLAHYGPRTLAKTMRRVGLKPVATHTPCYQYHRQSLPQAMHDLGVARYFHRLRRFTVDGDHHGETVAMPSPGMRKVLDGVGWLADKTHVGVVIVMIAQVP